MPVSDLFGGAGTALLDRLELSPAANLRVASLRRLIEVFDTEINQLTQVTTARLRDDPGYTAVQTLPVVGPVLGAVFVAEIGDVTGFAGPTRLTSWAGLTPKHHESDATVHRGPITQAGQPAGALGRSRGGATGQHT